MSLYGWGNQTHFFKCPFCDWSAEEEFERLKFLTQEHMEQHHRAQLPGFPQGIGKHDVLEAAPKKKIEAPGRIELKKNPVTGVYE